MKRRYQARSLREKLLLLLFAAACAVGWLTQASIRLARQGRDWRIVSAELAEQRDWFGQRAAIEARAARAAKNLQPGSTLDATHLVSEVVTLARQAGLTPGLDSPRTQRTPQFAYHTVEVDFRRAELGALVDFSEALNRRAPYLALERCALSADRTNPALLNASFVIFSVEVRR